MPEGIGKEWRCSPCRLCRDKCRCSRDLRIRILGVQDLSEISASLS
jgi:hypothetical protein